MYLLPLNKIERESLEVRKHIKIMKMLQEIEDENLVPEHITISVAGTRGTENRKQGILMRL